MRIRSTTILAVRRDGEVAIGGDGQVTLGDTAIKHGARKVRKIHNDQVLIGLRVPHRMQSPSMRIWRRNSNSIVGIFRNLRWNLHGSGVTIGC